MKPELLEKLLDAGFTKEEIFRLARDEPAAQEPDKTPQEPDKTPQEPDKTPLEPDKTAEKLNGIEKAIEELRKAVQANNVRNDSFGSPAESLETQTDKIMAGIIRPEHEKKEG